jgi:hypothetical protein
MCNLKFNSFFLRLSSRFIRYNSKGHKLPSTKPLRFVNGNSFPSLLIPLSALYTCRFGKLTFLFRNTGFTEGISNCCCQLCWCMLYLYISVLPWTVQLQIWDNFINFRDLYNCSRFEYNVINTTLNQLNYTKSLLTKQDSWNVWYYYHTVIKWSDTLFSLVYFYGGLELWWVSYKSKTYRYLL